MFDKRYIWSFMNKFGVKVVCKEKAIVGAFDLLGQIWSIL